MMRARKIVQSSTEQHITASQSEDRHDESQSKEAVNLSQNINETTNAVIEFTKVEYNDGTCETDTTKRAGDTATPKPRNRESKKPPNNHGGIKAITTGRININNNRNATHNRRRNLRTMTHNEITVAIAPVIAQRW